MSNVVQFPNIGEKLKREHFNFVREAFESSRDSFVDEEQWQELLDAYLRWWKELQEPEIRMPLENVSQENLGKVKRALKELNDRIISTLNLPLLDLIRAVNDCKMKRNNG